ncbi:MAG: acyl-CoA dehydrogenase [Firmicutes bacterium HGW-Firmicutes-15]|nr:MAG: acyl-CoA dehydrogenase [Firmicutes bacterium HGW-Firmicutes-15]
MDFNYTEEQLMLKDSVRKFSEKEIAPLVKWMETEKRTPRDLIKKIKDLGWCGIQYPEKYGGSGNSYIEYAIMQIEMSRVYCSTACTISVNGMLGANIMKFATEEQKMKFLPEHLNGDGIGSFAFTEPSTGSDPGALRTTCVRDGDEWVINGEKNFITNASMPGLMGIFCKDAEMGPGKCTNILIPKGIKGYSTPRIYDKMGMHGLEVCDVVLDNVRVPYENTTGGEAMRGKGFQVLLGSTQIGKLSVCAQAVGMAQAALEAAVQYSKERVQRGKPISNFQTIQSLIGDMATDVMVGHQIVLATAFKASEGKELAADAARTRLFTSEAVHRVASKAMQVMGAYSYTTEFPIERIFRDAKLTEIYEGVNEIQRLIAATDLLR